MKALAVKDLYSLEQYHGLRQDFRAKVLEHKRHRQIEIGPNATLYFEDRLTIQYQVQEMLRIERIFETEGIEEELSTYNPLIPDGSNLKATFMLEFPDVDERKVALQALRGVEDQTYMRVGDFSRVNAIADEDLERTDADKTSAVHFMRFEFSAEMVAALRAGAELFAGIDHPELQHEVMLSAASRESLLADFD